MRQLWAWVVVQFARLLRNIPLTVMCINEAVRKGEHRWTHARWRWYLYYNPRWKPGRGWKGKRLFPLTRAEEVYVPFYEAPRRVRAVGWAGKNAPRRTYKPARELTRK